MDLCCYRMNPNLSLMFKCFQINHWVAALVSFSFVWLCSEFSKSAKRLFQPDTLPCPPGRADKETFLRGNVESYSYVHLHFFLNVLETFCKLLYKSFKWSRNGKLQEKWFSHKQTMKDNELPLSLSDWRFHPNCPFFSNICLKCFPRIPFGDLNLLLSDLFLLPVAFQINEIVLREKKSFHYSSGEFFCSESCLFFTSETLQVTEHIT